MFLLLGLQFQVTGGVIVHKVVSIFRRFEGQILFSSFDDDIPNGDRHVQETSDQKDDVGVDAIQYDKLLAIFMAF